MEALFMQVFERRDWVEAQMQLQVASYSESVACAVLAAGRRPPPWLFPHSASAVATQGNTLRKPSLDLANPERADGVHHALPNWLAKPKTLEFGGVKPGSSNITDCSETINQCPNCVSETIPTEFTSMHPQNEDPPATNSLDVPHSFVSSLLQKDTLQFVEANLHEVPHSVTSLLPEKETTRAAETDSLEGPSSIGSRLLEHDSLQTVKPNSLEGIDSVSSSLPEKDTIHCAETDYPEGPYFTASLPLEKDEFYSDEANFLEGPHSTACLLLAKEPTITSETDSPEELHPMANQLHQKAPLHCVKTNSLEEPHPMASLLLEKETGHTSEATFLEGPYCMASPQLENEPEPLHTVEHTETSRSSFLDRCIDESSKILEHQSSEYHMLASACNESSLQPAQLADTTSGSPEMLGMPLENMVYDDYGCSPHPKENVLEDDCGHDSHSQFGGALSTCSLAKSANDDDVYQNNIVSSGTIINHNDSNSANASDAFICAQNEPSQMRSSLPKLSPEFDRTGTAVDIFMASSALFISNKSLEKEPVLDSVNCHLKQSGHAEAKLLVRSEAYDVSVRNNMDDSVTLEVLSGASSKSAQVLHTAERNITASANKCLRSLCHEGTEQKIFCFDIAMEINASSCTAVYDKQTESPQTSAQHLPGRSGSGEMVTSFMSDVQSTVSYQDRSIANGIQLQRKSSCERIVMDYQSDHVLYSSSSTMNTLSLYCQDDIHDQMETRDDLLGKPQPSVHNLSSSGSRVCIPLISGGRSDANNCKSSVAHEGCASANSSPERSMASPSDIICCNSPSMKASSCNGSNQSSNVSFIPQYSQSHSLENDLDTVTDSSPSCSDTLSDGDVRGVRKTISCFNYPDADVKTVTAQDKAVTEIDYVASGSGVLNPDSYPRTTSPTSFPSYALYQQSQQAYASNESIQEKLSYDSNLDFDEKCIDDGQPVSDGAIQWQNDNIYADYDETVQQHQSFSIPIPSNTSSPTIKERAFEGLCDSIKLVKLSSNLSAKYKMDSKMKPLNGVFQQLATRFEKLMNQSSINSVDTKRHDPSSDINKLGVSGRYSLELDGSFLISNVPTYDSSNANNVQEDTGIPLTPSVEKYSLEKLSTRNRSISECMGSIPELSCFQIDEDSSAAEENENQEKLHVCPGRNYSSQGLTSRKPLEHVNSLYQSREKSASLSTRSVDVGRLGLTTTKAYSREPDHHLHLRINQAIKDPEENRAPSIRKEGKVTQPLRDRASRTGILGSKNMRHRSEANLGEGWKPSNIVTNMTSFIPLVKQKQQPLTACVKKDVRVKALEAAEAAKRRQEKKQNERDMRKAAVELERERLKQERERKQKQVEQKDIYADVGTRKRQREDYEKKEKARKKKCIEEAQKQQKQQVERVHAANDEKDDSRKNSDDKELGKDLVGGVKLSDERTESVHRFIASESNNLKVVVADGSFESSTFQVQESFSDDVDKSYEMSPYKDSDEDDDEDNVEHKEEVRRRRKLIPSWAWEENLEKILLSNQTLDPREIFAYNHSFSLSDVLALHIHQRRFN